LGDKALKRLCENAVSYSNFHYEVINTAADGKEDLLQDFIAIITSFCARLYGQRGSKRKTEKIIAELTDGLFGH
jgi:predicted site-specific integrase-resolvase